MLSASVEQGALEPRGAYRLDVRYRLSPGQASASVRLRSQVDRQASAVTLPPRAELGWWSTTLTAPDDYDAGLYFVDFLIDGEGAALNLSEVRLSPAPRAQTASADGDHDSPNTDATDSSQRPSLPTEQLKRMPTLSPAALRRVWRTDGNTHTVTLAPLQQTERSRLVGAPFRDALRDIAAAPEHEPIAITWPAPQRAVGADPLPRRSALGLALALGIGAQPAQNHAFEHRRLTRILERFGAFESTTRFIGFWANEPRRGVDPGAFAHTSPWVRCSAYLNVDRQRALLVLINLSEQTPGRRGDVRFNHQALLGFTAHRDNVRCFDPETGVHASVAYDRKRGGWLENVWPDVSVPAGDYRLIWIEAKQ